MFHPISLFDDICSYFQYLDKRLYFEAKHNNFKEENSFKSTFTENEKIAVYLKGAGQDFIFSYI